MKNKLTQIINIRALAIFLVVLGHSIILYSGAWNLYQTSVQVPVLDELKNLINIIQMPLFFSLSGYLFVYTHEKKKGLLSLVRSKAARLLLPYIGIGIMYLLPIRLLVGLPSYQNMGVLGFVGKLLNASDMGHLWFLPALFLIFVLAELILTAAERIPGIRRFPVLLLCMAAFGVYLEGYRFSFGYGPLQSAFDYLIWFSLGYFVNVYQNLLRKVYSVSPVKWALLALNTSIFVYCLLADNVQGLIVLVVRALSIINAYGAMPEKTCSVLMNVDRNSFGMYLFHSPLIYITFAYIPNAHPGIVVFINLAVFGTAAFGLTEMIRKTKLRVLIGE